MTATINSYFAVLLITIAGAGATLLITHIANADTNNLDQIVMGSEKNYAPLQQSILKSQNGYNTSTQ
jgi:hypothetical protein